MDPSPRAAALAGLATKIGVRVETIEVDVAATEFTGRAYWSKSVHGKVKQLLSGY